MVVDSPVAVASSVRSSVVWEGARSVAWCRWPLGGFRLELQTINRRNCTITEKARLLSNLHRLPKL